MVFVISIHAPRERSDILQKLESFGFIHFNPRSSWEERLTRECLRPWLKIISIHAPRERSDQLSPALYIVHVRFQSTLLVRGATLSDGNAFKTESFQSTLLVRGATQTPAPLADRTKPFQSTLLVRGATMFSAIKSMFKDISIHAPRERSDKGDWTYTEEKTDFNPRSSWEERQ